MCYVRLKCCLLNNEHHEKAAIKNGAQNGRKAADRKETVVAKIVGDVRFLQNPPKILYDF